MDTKSKNLVKGDIVWLIKESKLERKFKWGLVVSVCKDDQGICRDAYVRVLPKPEGPEPYIQPYQKKGPFKTKLVAVPNRALFYRLDQQKEDKQKYIEESHKTNSTYKDQLFSSM